tara:strand:- start:207 stop:452 length:246 start_codon:yes stop_codon:yes gene_type:complete
MLTTGAQQVRYALYRPPVSLRARCQLRSATDSVEVTSATPQSNEVFHEAARPIACGTLAPGVGSVWESVRVEVWMAVRAAV